MSLRICVIGNFSDRRCGILNFCNQTVTALRHAGHAVTAFDGTYSEVYRRTQENREDPFWPPDLESFDVIHLIWHALTLNHYTGANWARFTFASAIKSFWDCGPSDAYCPFDAYFPVKWLLYPREGYHILDYPVPDWIDGLDGYQTTPGFVVGASSVRGDGVQQLQEIAIAEGWPTNLPEPSQWLTIEDEIRRLAKSVVNVCWYTSNAIWEDRASAPSMLIASTRPILINEDKMLAHLWDRPDVYHARGRGMQEALKEVHQDWRSGLLLRPQDCYRQMMWTIASARMAQVWTDARMAQGAV